MDRLTEIYNELYEMGVLVQSGSYHLKGDCDSVVVSDGNRFGVFLDQDKIRSLIQEYEAVTHEWSHIKTGALYPIDAPAIDRRRAEVKANRAQLRRVVPFDELSDLLMRGITEPYDIAEHFDVSEQTVLDAFAYYTGPCGLCFGQMEFSI